MNPHLLLGEYSKQGKILQTNRNVYYGSGMFEPFLMHFCIKCKLFAKGKATLSSIQFHCHEMEKNVHTYPTAVSFNALDTSSVM